MAQEALAWLEKEAKERQKENAIAHNTGKPNVAKMPPSAKGKSRDKAAALLGVSARYVSDAKKIRKKSRKLFEQVKSGEKTIADAKHSPGSVMPPQTRRLTVRG